MANRARSVPPSPAEPLTTGAAVKAADGARVRVAGVYRAVPRPIKGQPKPGAPAEHALLELDDGVRLWLEPNDRPEAIRAAEERARCDGRRVTATGVAHRIMPSAGAGLLAPCLSDVENVAAAG